MSNHIIGLGTKNGILFLAKEIWGLYASLRTNFILFILHVKKFGGKF